MKIVYNITDRKPLVKALEEITGAKAVYMHEERSIGVPSLAYVSVCLEGYISFGFDTHFLAEVQLKSEEAFGYENRNR